MSPPPPPPLATTTSLNTSSTTPTNGSSNKRRRVFAINSPLEATVMFSLPGAVDKKKHKHEVSSNEEEEDDDDYSVEKDEQEIYVVSCAVSNNGGSDGCGSSESDGEDEDGDELAAPFTSSSAPSKLAVTSTKMNQVTTSSASKNNKWLQIGRPLALPPRLPNPTEAICVLGIRYGGTTPVA